MSRTQHDSPYLDAAAHSRPASNGTARKARPGSTKTSHSATARPARDSKKPIREAKRSHRAGDEAPAPRRRRTRRKRAASPYGQPQLTSHPTGRAAYQETRSWLLAQHGPVCAYCGDRYTETVMTLDHVAPRRGQKAYDRRDNLVLACKDCNTAKRDLAPTAFLLARRTRAVHLLRYGSHLSPMLVDLAKSLLPPGMDIWDLDDESPYRD